MNREFLNKISRNIFTLRRYYDMIMRTAQHSTAQHSTAQHSTAQRENFLFVENFGVI